MKILTTFFVLFLISCSAYAQEFLVDPTNSAMSFVKDGIKYYSFDVRNNNETTNGHLLIGSTSGKFEETLVSLGSTSDGEKGVINVYNIKGDLGSNLSSSEFNMFDGQNSKVKITSRRGYEHYEDGILRFQIDGGAIQGYKSDGTRTIKISTSFGGDGRITTDELELLGGSDLSEHFDIENKIEEIQAGLLVSIANGNGKLEITNSKRDKKIVGVISGANGIETGLLMGQKGSIADGDYPVALTGRIYVHANTENGPIEAGDFLTSSSTPGYAMKVKKFKKAQGSIIGKAMTELAEGEGFILVLVNLQ